MDFFCLPIIFGFSQSLKQDEGQMPRVCPRCNNASVVSATKKTHFELFCVPIFPLSSKRVWACGICQWRIPVQQGLEPALPGQQGPPPVQWQQGMPPPGQWPQTPPPGQWPPGQAPGQFHPGYNPAYIPPQPQGHPPNK